MSIPVRCAAGSVRPQCRAPGPPGGRARDHLGWHRTGHPPHATGDLVGRCLGAAHAPDGPRAPRYALAAMTSPESCRRRPTHCTGTTPSTWATGSSRRVTAPRTTGPASSPTSRAAACSTSGPGTASTPSWPSGRGRHGSSRSTTTPGASTSPPAAPTGPSASSAARCPTSPATRRTSGSPTCRAGAGSSWPRRRWGRRSSRSLADFQTVDLDEVGQFDVVLYLGVLYHMKEPLTCLERLRAVTKEVAVIETEAVHIAGSRPRGAAAVPRRQLAADRLRELVRPDHRGPAQPVPGGRLLRGAHRHRAAAARRRRPPHRCRSGSGAGWPASRRSPPRRRPPTTAPSSTPSPERRGVGPGPAGTARVRVLPQSFSTV